jgi:hypothetical protein
MLEGLLAEQDTPSRRDSLFSAFRPPLDTLMTTVKLRDLQRRVYELLSLIAEDNLLGQEGAAARLARFVGLNPYSLQYGQQLDALLAQTGEQDGLRDNILLAKAELIADDQRRSEQLTALNAQYPETDGGMRALYELTRLEIRLYQREQKRENLIRAREMLSSFLDLYPDSFYAAQVRRNLDDLARLE